MNLNIFSTLLASLPFSVAMLSACGGTADVGNDQGNLNSAGSGNGGGVAAGTGGDTVSNAGATAAGGASNAGSPGAGGNTQHGTAGSAQGGATGTGGTPGAGGATGGTCGGFIGEQCATDQWCDYSDPLCGAADQSGVCKTRPQACDLIYAPVCGCDGKMYGNECEANRAGVDATSDRSCFPQDGGAGTSCTTDADCTLADDYCHGGCDCVALGPGEKAPTCANPVECLAEPCRVACGGQCAAHCDNGTCVAR